LAISRAFDISSQQVQVGRPIYLQAGINAHQRIQYACLTYRSKKPSPRCLGALDDKIELNRRMNATLEAMARALFKSWFVDFDPVRAKMAGKQPFGMDTATAALFPSRLVPSPLGDIPEGWSASNVGTEFDITMGQSPPGETYNESGDGLPFYQGRTDFGFRYPTRRIFCTQPNRVAEAGDTLISVRAPVGDINMAFEKCILGRGVGALRHKSKARSYTYYAIHSIQENIKAFEADGTVFGSINKQDVEKLSIIKPSPEAIKEFEKIIHKR
jgi:type I restriction enzyme S subunit